MSIGVHCPECGKTYQVSDKMAGRRGKCPNGHPISVPVIAEPLPDDSAFAFTSDTVAESAPRAKRQPAVGKLESQTAPVGAPAADDEFAFSAPIAGSSHGEKETAPRPKTGRHKAPDRAAGKAATGKPSMMPLILGAIIGVIGLGGGGAMFFVSKSQSGPLQDRAEQAEKKFEAADKKARDAESARLVTEGELEKARKGPAKDSGLEAELKATKKKLADAEKKLADKPKASGEASTAMKDLDPDAPGGKSDPVMPGGKLAAKGDMPAKTDPKAETPPEPKPAAPAKPNDNASEGPPLGGKNWSTPTKYALGKTEVKAGDRFWVRPQEDEQLKATGGKLVVKIKWELRKGKEVPPKVAATIAIHEETNIQTQTLPVTITGQSGTLEIPYDKLPKGKLPVTFYLSEPGKPQTAYSSMIEFQVDFGEGKK
jgi:hypothetical protein